MGGFAFHLISHAGSHLRASPLYRLQAGFHRHAAGAVYIVISVGRIGDRMPLAANVQQRDMKAAELVEHRLKIRKRLGGVLRSDPFHDGRRRALRRGAAMWMRSAAVNSASAFFAAARRAAPSQHAAKPERLDSLMRQQRRSPANSA